MHVLILGAGATGGYFGARLMEAGLDVSFLVREQRAKLLKNEGLRLISQKGDFSSPAKAILHTNDTENFDLIILSCKAYDLPSAIESIKPAVKEKTLVLPLLNGISHLEMLDKAFGKDHVLGGFCHLGVTVTEEGWIKHLNDLDILALGARFPSQQDRVHKIESKLLRARLTLTNSSRVMDEMWEKYVFVTVLAAITCLFRGSVGAINSTTHGTRLVEELFNDCVRAAENSGAHLSASWRETAFAALSSKDSTSTASMLRDLQKNGKTEHEHLLGNMLKYLEFSGIANKTLKAAYTHLQVYATTYL